MILAHSDDLFYLFRITLLIDKELPNTSVPSADIGEELLQAL